MRSESLVDTDPILSGQLAATAYHFSRGPETRRGMLAALATSLRPLLDKRVGVVGAMALSPDGGTLATGNTGGVHLWDTGTGRPVSGPPNEAGGDVRAVTFSPDGATLAITRVSTGLGATVQLWDARTGKPAAGSLTGNGLGNLTFGPDGRTLAVAGDDGFVQLWDTTAGQRVEQRFKAAAGPVSAVAITPDGRTLTTVAGGATGTGPDSGSASPAATEGLTVRSWDVTAGREKGDMSFTLPATSTGAHPLTALSRDGTRLAVLNRDNGDEIRFWETRTHRQVGDSLKLHAGGLSSIAFSQDGGTLIIGDLSGNVLSYDTKARQPKGAPFRAAVKGRSSVALSPDGEILAVGDRHGDVRLWNTRTRRRLGGPLKTHRGRVSDVAFGPDGTTLATAGGDGTARLWDVETRSPIGKRLREHSPFSSLGEILADPKGGKYIAVYDSVLPGPDRDTLASIDEDGTLWLWDVTEGFHLPLSENDDVSSALPGITDLPGLGEKDSSVLGADYRAYLMAFSPDGESLATVGADDLLQLWGTGTHTSSYKEQVGPAEAMAFSQDGTVLAAAGKDGTVRLWNVGTSEGSEASVTLKGRGGSVEAVAFSQDGATLTALSGDGTVQLWETGIPSDPFAAICALTGRTLSEPEWRTYLPDRPFVGVCPDKGVAFE
ncbi:WD40 repeat domain-containing protein [Streptosporangium sp. NPDC051023]|uniref:WD40 repeat domain-containing protein n=1 Tax=Streptosporangium sp. NPDC051023 TaxID=3155410 RepID=UPI00344EFC28